MLDTPTCSPYIVASRSLLRNMQEAFKEATYAIDMINILNPVSWLFIQPKDEWLRIEVVQSL